MVEAAAGIVREHGPHAVSAAAVADLMGVTPANVYKHFSSKNEILDAVLQLLQGRILEALEGVARTAPVPARLQLLLETHNRFQEGMFFQSENMRQFFLYAASRPQAWSGFVTGFAQLLTGLAKDGIDEGYFAAAEPAVLASRMILLLKGIMHPLLLNEIDPENREELTREVVDAVIRSASV